MFRTFLSRGLILLVVCLLGIGILQTSGQSGSITGTVSLLPTTWDTQWLNQTTGTIRCYIGNLSGGRTVSQIIPSSIRLNNTVPLYNNTSRIRPSQTGFTGAVLEGAFFRPAALASMGWVVPGRSYPVVISGQFQDQVPFTCTAQILIGGPALVDNAAPVVTITGVSNNQCTAASVTPVITVTDQYLNVVTITMDGQGFVSGTTVSTEGNHVLHVAASDQAGNNTVRDVSFTIDQSNPVITIGGVTEGECRQGSVIPAITITDACLGVTTITLNGQPYISGTPITSDGNYLIQVEASDLSGHTASQDINFIIDQTAPVAGSNVTDGQVSATPLQIYAQCTDANPAGSVLTIDGQIVADGATLSVDGTYLIVVTCTDCAGNSGQYQATVAIQSQTSTDTEIPGIFIITPENKSKTNNPQPTVTITYKDQESGINQSSLNATLNGESIAGQFSLNADGGSYQPGQALANGAYTLNVSIQDNAGNSNSASCSFEIDVARPTETPLTGYIQGIVYAENMETPLVNALVTGRDSQLQTLAGRILTDSLGRFSYPTPGQGKYYIDITKPGYTYAQRQAEVVTDQPVGVDDIVLLPFDPAVTTITPSGGSHASSDGHLVIEFPSGAVTSPINVIATEVDSAFQLPSALPGSSVFTYCFELEPHGQVFNLPVTVKVNNYLGFSPGDSIPVGIFSPELGGWQHMTMAYVDPDGEWITYETLRFSFHDVNASAKKQAVQNVRPEPDQTRKDNDTKKAHGCTGSKYEFQSGNLMVDFELPSVATLGVGTGLTFSYNSNTAHPSLIVNKNVILRPSMTEPLCSKPDIVGMKLNVAGAVTEHFFNWQFMNCDQFVRARFAEARSLKDSDGDWLPTGRYRYNLAISGYKYDDEYYFTNIFAGEPLIKSNVAIRDGVLYTWMGFGYFSEFVVVNNQRNSAFGGGWGLDGLYSILGITEDTSSLPLSIYLANGSSQLLEFAAIDSTQLSPGRTYVSSAYSDMTIEGSVGSNIERSFVLRSTSGTATEFDSSGKMTSVKYPNDIVYSYDYDGAGRLVTITDPLSRHIRFSYDNLGHLASVVDQVGRRTDFDINPQNELTTVTLPDGSVKAFEYDDQLMVKQIDQNRNATDYVYRNDRLHQIIGPTCCGASTLTLVPSNSQNLANDLPDVCIGSRCYRSGTINHPARLLSSAATWDLVIGARSDTTRMRCNASGQVVYSIDPLINITQSEYDDAGQLTKSISSDGGVSQFAYDSTGQLIQFLDPSGAVSNFAYSYLNDYGKPVLTEAVDPNGNITRFSYDNKGNRTSEENALGEMTVFSYDSLGFVTSITNAQGDSTLMRYDSLHNLVSVISPLGDSIVMVYDSIGNRIAQIDNNGNRTEHEYDIMGRIIRTIDPAGNATQYTYDLNGNIISIEDANGHATTYTYDGKNHLIRSTDAMGNASEYKYDLSGNLALEITPNGDSITYVYDLANRAISKIFPEGTVQYSYDLGGRLSRVTNGSIVDAFTYDLRGKVVATSSSSGVRLAHSYDPAGNQIETAVSKSENPFDAGASYDAGTNPRCVVAADLNKDGAIDLVVSNATTNDLSVSMNLGDGTFGPATSVPTGGANLREVVAADFDNDGSIDLAVAGLSSTGISVLYNLGDGTFGAPSMILGITASRTIEVQDFDQDGDLDMAVSVTDANFCVRLLRNDGNRQFVLENSISAPGANASYVVAADLDRDGAIDLIVGSNVSPNVLIFKNAGLGNMTFETTPTAYILTQLGNTLAVAVSDLNGDRAPDMAFVTANSNRDSLAIMYNNGSGLFSSPALYLNDHDSRDVVARDFDGDGFMDLATVSAPSGILTIWKNDGTGGLQAVSRTPSGKQPTWLCSEDLDGNGLPDVGTANITTDVVAGQFVVHLNPGMIHASSAKDYSVGPATNLTGYDQLITNIETGDWNYDGFPDFAVTRLNRNDVGVRMSQGDGTFGPVLNLPFTDAVNDVGKGDVNYDGTDELIVASNSGITVFGEFNGSAFNSFTYPVDIGGFVAPQSIAVADMDGDGFSDDVVLHYGAPSIVVLYTDGPFDLSRTVEIPTNDVPSKIVASDLDNDGDIDIAFTSYWANSVTVIDNLGIVGSEEFSQATYPTALNPNNICAADLDHDGDQDIALTYWFTSPETINASVLRNQGDGTFGPRETIVASAIWASDVAPIDYDRDGYMDLLINDWWAGSVGVFANIQGSSFVKVSKYCSGPSSFCLAVADFNRDGRSDYAVGDYFGNSVAIVHNSHSGKPLRQAISRTVDSLNRVGTLTATNSELANPISFAWAYDNLGRPAIVTTSNGLSTQYAFDKKSRLLELSYAHNGQPIESFAYTYDPNGNRISRTDHYGTRTYSYDQLNQLVSAVQPAPLPQESYNYDPLGNRVTSHLSQQHAHDAGNRLLEDDQYIYEYDANGNLVLQTGKTNGIIKEFTFNAENQLVGYEEHRGGALAATASYDYDGLGRRVAKTVNGIVTRYVYDSEDIVLELDGQDSARAYYIHGPGIDNPLAMSRGDEVYSYVKDGLNSVTGIVDTGGNVITEYLYDSYGKIMQRIGAVESPYTFTGREYDTESNLYYYRARYYDPNFGHFLSGDPIPHLNRYSYVDNCPTSLVDALGLESCPPKDGDGSESSNGLFDDLKSGLWAFTSFVIDAFASGSVLKTPAPDLPGPIQSAEVSVALAEGFSAIAQKRVDNYFEYGDLEGEWGTGNPYYPPLNGVKARGQLKDGDMSGYKDLTGDGQADAFYWQPSGRLVPIR